MGKRVGLASIFVCLSLLPLSLARLEAADCTFDVTPTAIHAARGAAVYNIRVTTMPGCSWSVANSTTWLAVTPWTGSTSGVLTLDVVANPSGSPRQSSVTVAGVVVTIYQDGCATIQPDALGAAREGGVFRVQLTAAADCSWNVQNAVSWLAVTPWVGQGSATLIVDVVAYPGTTPRSGTMRLNGVVPLTVSQQGCASVSPRSIDFPYAGGSVTVRVSTATTSCGWNTENSVSWAAVVPWTGSASTTVTVSALQNSSPAPRRSKIKVAGQTISLQQAGCAAVVPDTINAGGGGGTYPAYVVTNPDCSWSTANNVPWVSVTPSKGTTTEDLIVSVLQSNVPDPRVGQITIAGHPVFVTQEAGCKFEVAPRQIDAPVSGGSFPVQVTSSPDCSWAGLNNIPWVAVTPGLGQGSGTVNVDIVSNASLPRRSGVIKIAGQSVMLNQAGVISAPGPTPPPGCDGLRLSPGPITFSSNGGAGAVEVNVDGSCSWTASTGSSWISFTSPTSRNGNGWINFAVAQNGSSVRSGEIRVVNKSVAITQQGAPYTPDQMQRFLTAWNAIKPLDATAVGSVPAALDALWAQNLPADGTVPYFASSLADAINNDLHSPSTLAWSCPQKQQRIDRLTEAAGIFEGAAHIAQALALLNVLNPSGPEFAAAGIAYNAISYGIKRYIDASVRPRPCS
jgi:hypothetical protein